MHKNTPIEKKKKLIGLRKPDSSRSNNLKISGTKT
jgi:hypothetical protein